MVRTTHAVARDRETLHKLNAQRAKLEYIALTDLPNRTLFHDRVHEALTASQRDGQGGAVIILDLERFKEVNDTLGHHNGDLLVTEVARRLQGLRGQGDTIPDSAGTSSRCW